MDVRIDRPELPEGYGLPTTDEDLIAWADVERRLEAATEFWMATTRPGGRPHVIPRWGVWLDGRFWYDGSPQTRHVRNLAANPACTMHLESGTEVVIIDGESSPSEPVTGELGIRLSERFVAKYGGQGYTPGPDAWAGDGAGGLCMFRPHKALAWFSFPQDVTRFRFTS